MLRQTKIPSWVAFWGETGLKNSKTGKTTTKSLKILMGISNGPDQQDFSETNSFLDVSSADDNFNSNSTNYLFTNSITFENLKLMSIMFIICCSMQLSLSKTKIVSSTFFSF